MKFSVAFIALVLGVAQSVSAASVSKREVQHRPGHGGGDDDYDDDYDGPWRGGRGGGNGGSGGGGPRDVCPRGLMAPANYGPPFIWGLDATTKGVAPDGSQQYFRRVYQTPRGKRAVCAKIILFVDDHFTGFFLNGQLIGSSPDWHNYRLARTYSVSLQPNVNVFALQAGDFSRQAAVSAQINVAYSDGSFDTWRADGSWKVATSPPVAISGPNYFDNGYDDSAWANVKVLDYP